MPNATPFNTCFCGPDGLDIGSKLLEKDQLLETYSGLIPSVQGKNIYANGCGLNFVLGTGSTVTASPGTLACTIDAPNWTQITSSWKFPLSSPAEEMASAAGIKSDGTLWTWGTNCCGRLGDGTTIIKCSPVQTIAGGTDWCSVSISKFRLSDNRRTHTAALKRDGSLWLWGYNGEAGGLGIGTAGFNASVSSPVQTVAAGNNWSKVTTGTQFTIAQKTDGTLWSWGLNLYGQLGDNTVSCRSSPVQVAGGITNWCAISAGHSHVVALRPDNTLWVWGSNKYGQQGRNAGYYACISQPAQVGTASTWCSIAAAGYSNIAVKTDSSLWVWGFNLCGELPLGTSSYGTYPGPIIDPPCRYSSVVQVVGASLGWKKVFPNLMAQKVDGSLWCWSKNTAASPVQFVDGVKNWVNVSGKFQIRDNEVLCSDLSGFKFTHSSLGSVDFDDVYVRKCCFADGEIWKSGQEIIPQISAVITSSLVQFSRSNWKVISAGGTNAAGIKQDGTLWNWGYGGNGALGDGTTITKSSPIQTISGGTGWRKVAVGSNFAAGIKNDGSLWLWGYGNCGKLGDNSTIDKCSPVQTISTGTNWKSIALGTEHSAAIKTDGTLWTWGRNQCGALGNNTTINRSSPVQVGTDTTWRQVSVCFGERNTGGIKTDGTLWIWGYNGNGVLGTNNKTNQSSPVQTIAGGTNWVCLATDGNTAWGIKTDGTLWGWGNNNVGQLGINSVSGPTDARSSPVQTILQGTNWKKISPHPAAIKADGSLWVWGCNINGTLGDNSTINKYCPIQIGSQYYWSDVSVSNGTGGLLLATREDEYPIISGGGGGGTGL